MTNVRRLLFLIGHSSFEIRHSPRCSSVFSVTSVAFYLGSLRLPRLCNWS
jgi:hypothetical protein